MKPRLKSSRAARELIKAHEPFRPQAEPKGKRWVVGYGHTSAAREGVSLTKDDADLILLYDVLQAEQAIDAAVGEDLSQNARDALVSFACSIGPRAFKVCDVARLAAAGRHREAAAAMETWVRAQEGGRQVVSERLVRRRAAESALYLRADEAAGAPPAADPSEDDEPKLGALVELDIAFEEPAEAAPEFEPEPEPETAVEPDPEPEPVAEPAPSPAPSADEEAAARADAKVRQDEVVRSVMARMAAQIADSVERTPPQPKPVAEPAPEAEPEAEARVSDDARLGFSFLTPWTAPAPDADFDAPHGASGQPEAEPQPERAPETALGPVYASPVDAPEAEPAAVDEPAPPHPANAPADAEGVSGEVGGTGRPAETEAEFETDAMDDQALHPGVVAGPEAESGAQARGGDALEPDGRGGDWVFFANLAVGLGLLGAGGWDLATHFETYRDQGFFFFGPVAFAAGLVLTVASAWFLVSRFLRRRG